MSQSNLNHQPFDEVCTYVDSQQWLHAHVLTPLQELEISETIGVVVRPVRRSAGTVDQRADVLLPLPPGIDAESLEVVASGEPQEFGLESSKVLGQVLTQAIGSVLVCGREQRNQIEEERVSGNLGTIEGDGEGVVAVGGGLRRGQCGLELRVVARAERAVDFQRLLGKDLASAVGADRSINLRDLVGVEGVVRLDVERRSIGMSISMLAGIDPPELM